MHYLGLAFYGEGASDYQFLRPVLQRICESICVECAASPVDVSQVISLDHASGDADRPRSVRILGAARQHSGAWRILFVHSDGAGDVESARANLVDPALAALAPEFAGCAGVGVVPVRETEAWAICDGDALREVFGTTLSDEELGIPLSVNDVESDIDPKRTLREAFQNTSPAPQRRRRGVSPLLNALGDAVSIDRLRRLPSFQGLEKELKLALEGIGVLR